MTSPATSSAFDALQRLLELAVTAARRERECVKEARHLVRTYAAGEVDDPHLAHHADEDEAVADDRSAASDDAFEDRMARIVPRAAMEAAPGTNAAVVAATQVVSSSVSLLQVGAGSPALPPPSPPIGHPSLPPSLLQVAASENLRLEKLLATLNTALENAISAELEVRQRRGGEREAELEVRQSWDGEARGTAFRAAVVVLLRWFGRAGLASKASSNPFSLSLPLAAAAAARRKRWPSVRRGAPRPTRRRPKSRRPRLTCR